MWYQNQPMHVSVWKYIIHIVYLLHVSTNHGRLRGGALKSRDTAKYYKVFEPMHLYKVFRFINNTWFIWSHVLFLKVNVLRIYLCVCSDPTERFRCKVHNVLSYTWFVWISYPIAPRRAMDHLKLLNSVFIRIAKKSCFYDLERTPRIFGVSNRILPLRRDRAA